MGTAPHFPRLVEWGFEEGEKAERGVLVYRYVPGNELAAESMQPHAVAWVGRCLAAAVLQLSTLGIVHRDIKPSNVVFQAGGDNPGSIVLLDFGLSRMPGHQSLTMGAGSVGYLPPEVRSDGPRAWTSQGDLYAVGILLENLLVAGAVVPTSLARLISQLRSPEPRQRGEPAAVLDEFDRVVSSGPDSVEIARQTALQRYDSIFESVPARFRSVAEKHRDLFALYQLGPGVAETRRCMDAAVLLNDFYEATARERLGRTSRTEGTSLAAASILAKKDPGLSRFDKNVCVAVGKLRNAASHSDWEQGIAAAKKKAGRKGLRGALMETARLLDLELCEGDRALEEVIEVLLGE